MSREGIPQTDAAVGESTGRTWAEWEAVLDAAGVVDLSHRELVAWLRDEGGVESGWWRQTIAVGYEKLKGKRVVGQTADGRFQVGVQRTLPLGPDEAWALLTSPEGVGAWLGDVGRLRFEEGERWRAPAGSKAGATATGEIRVVRPGSHARLTRNPGGWARPSTIQVRVEARGDRAVVGFHEESLPREEDREERRAHYRAALDRLAALAAS